jgi:hypothetical protein
MRGDVNGVRQALLCSSSVGNAVCIRRIGLGNTDACWRSEFILSRTLRLLNRESTPCHSVAT